jgi:RHS repeat-associated protein
MKLGDGVGREPSPDAATYTYAGIGYADPDAVTQIANGLSTSTFSYDNNGNLTQKTVGGTSTTYVYDYANRLIALGAGGATTTYGYDAFGSRVLQTGTSTTYLYPFKWLSVASSTGTGAKYATTTSYMFNGDTLLATVDQQTASGVATGTAKTRYVHPDHLGSTNVVTDENDNVVQTMDYYPYGATRISVSTSTKEKRQFIGQFTDDSTLSYLNARFYDSGRGQFMSEDPVFWGKQDLSDPQALNTYSYANDNPILKEDPSGKCPWCIVAAGVFGGAGGAAYQGYQNYQNAGTSFPGSFSDNMKSYGVATGVGAAAGFGAAYAGTIAAAYELSSILTFGAVGGTAGGLNFRLTVTGNSITGLPTDYEKLGYDSSIDALTGGALTFLPGARGALPGAFTSAINFFSYTHAARWGAESAVNTSMSALGSGLYNQGGGNSNAGSSGGISQLAGAVVNYANT